MSLSQRRKAAEMDKQRSVLLMPARWQCMRVTCRVGVWPLRRAEVFRLDHVDTSSRALWAEPPNDTRRGCTRGLATRAGVGKRNRFNGGATKCQFCCGKLHQTARLFASSIHAGRCYARPSVVVASIRVLRAAARRATMEAPVSASQRPWWHRLKWVQASQEEAVAAEQALLACAPPTCVLRVARGVLVEPACRVFTRPLPRVAGTPASRRLTPESAPASSTSCTPSAARRRPQCLRKEPRRPRRLWFSYLDTALALLSFGATWARWRCSLRGRCMQSTGWARA